MKRLLSSPATRASLSPCRKRKSPLRQSLAKLIMRMMRSNSVGLLYGPLHHHLDHLAPFCSLKGIPLVITEETIAKQAQLYYPDLKILQWNSLEAPFKITETF